jgi:hypothetical protein
MTFLAPLGLIWLASLPVWVWLWRLSASRRVVRVPSLVPFEHLVRRQARRRTRLVVNSLFWLQLAALLALILAIARPALLRPHVRRWLVIVDTSASMAARRGSTTAMARARQAARDQIRRKAAADAVLLMTTAPVHAVTPRPTSDLQE